VIVPDGAFVDKSGKDIKGITDPNGWNYTMEGGTDEDAPVVSSLSPADEATGVTIDADLVITFDEQVSKGKGNITINQGVTSQTIAVSSGRVSINGTIVTINPPVDFPNSATITVTVPKGAFTDEAGNEFAGITASEWSFTTEAPEDNQAPSVITYLPADNATKVALTSDLRLTFSEEVVKGTGNITINQGTTSQIINVTDAAVSVNGTTVTINPADFPSQTAINVRIEAGSFKDLAGNNYAGITDNSIWNFTTEDKTAPTLTSFTPANNATDIAVNTNLVIKFSEAIKAGTGDIVITQGAASQNISVTNRDCCHQLAFYYH
jgi:methionine-rich copper-binding protein CopC